MGRDLPLEVDRDVAQPDGAVAGVEQRPRHDPHRVGEVDDPRVLGGELACPLGDLEHHRYRPHRLPEATGPGRLLADAAARGRDRLVPEARRLTADPDLDQDDLGTVERAVEVTGDRELAGEPLTLEDSPGEATHDLTAFGVDVVQHEVAY